MGPGRVLLTGDVHANWPRLSEAIDLAGELGCTHLVQVGDFGWFPQQRWGREFISAVTDACARGTVTVCFLGGNHDDWDDLDGRCVSGERDGDGLVVLGERLRYIPRPHRWVWGGCTLGALGGAWSIDWRRRVPFITWWPHEEPTEAQADALCGHGPLDVLLTHDAPGEVDLSPGAADGDDLGGGSGVRALVDMVAARTAASVAVHGHWHLAHDTQLASGTRCVGLGDDRGSLADQVAVLDTATGEVTHDPRPQLAVREPLWPG